ncbi:hypothetical protein HQ576_01070 [bacterium]|nr:hypothetical protein [bacterium]
MSEPEYVTMPQDDMAQIDQVAREYSSDPAKGLAHGLQKDAIQNSFGARAAEKEAEACKEWATTFELRKIGRKPAIVFWDQGTTGLTGGILDAEQIRQRFVAGNLGPEQRLGRFLARFVSGDNLGAGSFGRGKLVFHAASNTTSILVDSFRLDDGKYIALDRAVRDGALKQPRVPYVGDAAREFVTDKACGALEPLTAPGTRIAIFDVKPEISQAFRASFSSSPSEYRTSFAHMIEETWWEIIHRFGARLFLRSGTNELRVQLTDPLVAVAGAVDGQDAAQVHVKTNISLTAGGERHRVKELKLVVMPGNLDEELQDIWLQRKRMKVGSVSRYIYPHHKIAKRLAGYVVLEPPLEALVEKAEGTTHYGFDLRANGVKQVRETVRAQLKAFENRLGLVSTTEDAQSRRRLLDSMKELNEIAKELGLLTQQNMGLRKSDVDLLLVDMQLPDPDTLRVEIGDTVGPTLYELVSNTGTLLTGTFQVHAAQPGREPLELCRHSCPLAPNERKEKEVGAFTLKRNEIENGKALRVVATYVDESGTKSLARCSRTLYVGTEPPSPETPVTLKVYAKFPRSDTRRVELSEVVRQIRIRATNNTPHNLTVDVVSSVRHVANPKTGRITTPLFDLFVEQKLQLGPQQDYDRAIDDLVISHELFGAVQNTVADVSERTCDLHTVVRLAKASKELQKPRKFRLNTSSIVFYLEVDPPGHSIFRETKLVDEPSDGRQSWHEGTVDEGYAFLLNAGHAAYRFTCNAGSSEMIKRYEQEQMLRQAYLIAFKNDVYRGPAEPHRSSLTAEALPAHEVARIFDEIVGTALNQMQS